MTGVKIGQARTMDGFGEIMGVAMQGDKPNHRPYAAQAGDTFITSWAKSGTTLMQQMFHQLRTAKSGGDMDFDDISRVLPWDDTAMMLDFDMNAAQPGDPRGFKSHREYERLPEGMRYVVSLRDPKETYVSFYRFINGWHLERDAVSMEDFMPLWMSGGPGGCDYFTHLMSWYPRRNERDSLIMTYRWAVKNRPAAIREMARLCDIDLTPHGEAMIMERTTREFMHEHKDRFDDGMICAVLEEKCGIPAASDSSKVQATGSKADALPETIAEAIDAMWAERVLPATGHANFASIAKEVDAMFAAG